MELDIIVELEASAAGLAARDVSRWLLCLATIRDALFGMDDSSYVLSNHPWLPYIETWFIRWGQSSLYFVESDNTTFGPLPLNYYLKQLGRDLLVSGRIPRYRNASYYAKRGMLEINLFFQEIMDGTRPVPTQARGLELISVVQGSISTRIKETIDWLVEHFRNLVEAGNGFIDEGNRETFYQTVRQVASNRRSRFLDQEILAGILVASGLEMEQILATLHARKLKIRLVDSGEELEPGE